MSKAKLIFKMPDEAGEFEHAAKGSDWRAMVQMLDNRLRDALKYEEDLSVEKRDALNHCRQLIQRGVDEANLKLWD